MRNNFVKKYFMHTKRVLKEIGLALLGDNENRYVVDLSKGR